MVTSHVFLIPCFFLFILPKLRIGSFWLFRNLPCVNFNKVYYH